MARMDSVVKTVHTFGVDGITTWTIQPYKVVGEVFESVGIVSITAGHEQGRMLTRGRWWYTQAEAYDALLKAKEAEIEKEKIYLQQLERSRDQIAERLAKAKEDQK